MRTLLIITILSLASLSACSSPPSSDDDGGGVTTTPGETSGGSAGETSGESSSGTDGSETDSSAFMPEPDFISNEVCSLYAQDCPVGEKCVPYVAGDSWDALKCVPIMGDQHATETCWSDGVNEATDNCDATSICWGLVETEGEQNGYCLPMCTGSADEPMCPEGFWGHIGSDSPLCVCEQICHPLTQECAVGRGCYWDGQQFNCDPPGDIATGEACGYINDCAPGHLCLNGEYLPMCLFASCCTAFCDLLLGDGGCAAQPGSVCVPFFDPDPDPAPPGDENVGVCISPP